MFAKINAAALNGLAHIAEYEAAKGFREDERKLAYRSDDRKAISEALADEITEHALENARKPSYDSKYRPKLFLIRYAEDFEATISRMTAELLRERGFEVEVQCSHGYSYFNRENKWKSECRDLSVVRCQPLFNIQWRGR